MREEAHDQSDEFLQFDTRPPASLGIRTEGGERGGITPVSKVLNAGDPARRFSPQGLAHRAKTNLWFLHVHNFYTKMPRGRSSHLCPLSEGRVDNAHIRLRWEGHDFPFDSPWALTQKWTPPWLLEQDPSVAKSLWDPTPFDCPSSEKPITFLHNELRDFVRWICPTEEEDLVREWVLARLQLFTAKWMAKEDTIRDVVAFGSYSTKTYLPFGDIDAFVDSGVQEEGVRKKQLEWLDKGLFESLKHRGYYLYVRNAKVPIIKYCDPEGGILVDLSIGGRGGSQGVRFIKEQMKLHPALYPMIMVMKMLLWLHDLHEPKDGGLGSMSLAVMILASLNANPTMTPAKEKMNLGLCFMKFLHDFGKLINYRTVGISYQGFFLKGIHRPELALDNQNALWLTIADPVDPTNNLTRGCKQSHNICDMFYRCFTVMSSLIGRYGRNQEWPDKADPPDSKLRPRTLLGSLMWHDLTPVMDQRDRWRQLYRSIIDARKADERHEPTPQEARLFADASEYPFESAREARDAEATPSRPHKKARGRAGQRGAMPPLNGRPQRDGGKRDKANGRMDQQRNINLNGEGENAGGRPGRKRRQSRQKRKAEKIS